MFPVLKQVYNDNKAPFGLNMHAAWFFFDDYLKAADTFIKKLLEMDDVYIVSVAQALDWMRNPVEVWSSYGGRGLLGFLFFRPSISLIIVGITYERILYNFKHHTSKSVPNRF